MVSVVIMGVLISMAIPRFGNSFEQSRATVAAANLRSIWAAERIYWLDQRKYTDLQTLIDNKLVDAAALPTGTGSTTKPIYVYSMSFDPDLPQIFTAKAELQNSPSWEGYITIDQNGAMSGQHSDGVYPVKIIK